MQVREFFGQLFTIDQKRKDANRSILAFDRWFLEFARNTMVVAVLFAVAHKSGRWYLYAFAFAAGLALWGTVYALLDPIVPNPRFIRNKSVTVLSILLAAAASALAVFALSSALGTIITEIVQMQMPK